MVTSSETGLRWGKAITNSILFISFSNAVLKPCSFSVLFNFTVARNSCQPGLNDCSQHATCTAEGASYSCQCNKGFTDNSPQVPGRVCQQKLNLPSRNCFLSLSLFIFLKKKALKICIQGLFPHLTLRQVVVLYDYLHWPLVDWILYENGYHS